MWRALVILAVAGIAASAVIPSESEDSRIVSGWQAEEGQFPYALFVRGITREGVVTACAGSIVHLNWALSSGQCVAQRVAIIVSGGAVNRHRPRFLQETYEYYTAPGFNQDTYQIVQPNDISLIRLPQSLTFSAMVQPIRLQRTNQINRDFLGVRMTAVGWGLTWTGGELSDNLNWVYLSGIGNYHCDVLYNFNGVVQNSTLCAIYRNVPTQSICAGDGGGPLTFVERNRNYAYQIGVASFLSDEGCHLEMTSGFVRPVFYHDWIRQITGVNLDGGWWMR